MPPPNEGERLTVDEAAKRIGVSKSTTRRLIRSGELPVYRPTERKIWVLSEDLDDFLESHRYRNAPGEDIGDG